VEGNALVGLGFFVISLLAAWLGFVMLSAIAAIAKGLFFLFMSLAGIFLTAGLTLIKRPRT
jgi:uncharacterized membrane protein YtjA (UPF0391 family)